MDKRVLKERKWNSADYPDLRDSLYSAHDLFEKFVSIVGVRLTNISSSAGDWDGFIVQKINNRSYVIPFWQENNYPYRGFTIHTENPFISFIGNYKLDDIEKYFCGYYYG